MSLLKIFQTNNKTSNHEVHVWTQKDTMRSVCFFSDPTHITY